MSGLNGMGNQVRRLEDRVLRPVDELDGMDRMSEEELSEYLIQCRIESTLESGDQAAADRWRSCLGEEKEQIVQQFLRIDESSIPNPSSPSWVGPDAPKVQEGSVIYSLNRLNFRYDRGRIERHRDRLHIDDFQAMFRWLDAYETKE